MPLVKKLSKLCKRCGKLYPTHAKYNGICPKCDKRGVSWLIKLANKSKSIQSRHSA